VDVINVIVNIFIAVMALYAAVISTILGIRELQKEKKLIRIFIQYVGWGEVYTLKIINVGQRPITISSVSVSMKRTHKEDGTIYYEPIQDGWIFTIDSSTHFPVKLEDGDSIELQFSEVMQGLLRANNGDAGLCVFDIEGNSYVKYEKLYFDAKYNYFAPITDLIKQKKFLGIKLPLKFWAKKK